MRCIRSIRNKRNKRNKLLRPSARRSGRDCSAAGCGSPRPLGLRPQSVSEQPRRYQPERTGIRSRHTAGKLAGEPRLKPMTRSVAFTPANLPADYDASGPSSTGRLLPRCGSCQGPARSGTREREWERDSGGKDLARVFGLVWGDALGRARWSWRGTVGNTGWRVSSEQPRLPGGEAVGPNFIGWRIGERAAWGRFR